MLSGADLSGADLSWSDLSESDLSPEPASPGQDSRRRNHARRHQAHMNGDLWQARASPGGLILEGATLPDLTDLEALRAGQ